MKVVIPNRLVRRARRGSALVAALFVVLMVGTLSMAYLQMSVSKNKEQQTAADAKRAFYVAEDWPLVLPEADTSSRHPPLTVVESR